MGGNKAILLFRTHVGLFSLCLSGPIDTNFFFLLKSIRLVTTVPSVDCAVLNNKRSSTHDLEEIFWRMLSPGEMAREHLRAVVKSIDPGGTGEIGLREVVTFVRARQGGGACKAGKAAEIGLRRCVPVSKHYFGRKMLIHGTNRYKLMSKFEKY